MYELHVYGGTHIEESRDTYETRERAKMEAERRSTDNTDGWREHDVQGGVDVLVDHNHSDDQKDLVIMKVQEK